MARVTIGSYEDPNGSDEECLSASEWLCDSLGTYLASRFPGETFRVGHEPSTDARVRAGDEETEERVADAVEAWMFREFENALAKWAEQYYSPKEENWVMAEEFDRSRIIGKPLADVQAMGLEWDFGFPVCEERDGILTVVDTVDTGEGTPGYRIIGCEYAVIWDEDDEDEGEQE